MKLGILYTATLETILVSSAHTSYTILAFPVVNSKQGMEELIRNAYSTRDISHIISGNDYAYWTSRPIANTHNLTANQLAEMFNFLIYIQIGSAIYSQTIVIPMGTDCAPLVADLFLFPYEFEISEPD